MRTAFSLAVVLFLTPLALSQSTWYVPDDFSTIQAAIDASMNGDTIIVRPGVYVENINFPDKAIALTSEHGPSVTTISGNGAGSVIVLGDMYEDGLLISGFTISDGVPYGIHADRIGGLTINDCIISNNVGHGIRTYEIGPLTITNCTIHNNTSNGISCGTDSLGYEGVISDCSIYHNGDHGVSVYESIGSVLQNHIYGNGKSGIYLTYARSTVSQNVINDNLSSGVHCRYGAGPPVFILNNLIYNNSAERGGGLHVEDDYTVLFYNNTVWENSASFHGGGVYSDGDGAVVVNCILWNNSAQLLGKEVCIADFQSSVMVSHADIQGGLNSIYVETGANLDWGPGNIDADPLLVDPDNGDFHLTWDSPCCDTGNNANVSAVLDWEGDPRIARGTVDMGADEFYYHLYQIGDVTPGTFVSVRVVGQPGAGIVLAEGSGIKDPPSPSRYGLIYLEPPVTRYPLGIIPASGVRTVSAIVPTLWNSGEVHPFQALLWGSSTRLTNLMTVTVD